MDALGGAAGTATALVVRLADSAGATAIDARPDAAAGAFVTEAGAAGKGTLADTADDAPPKDGAEDDGQRLRTAGAGAGAGGADEDAGGDGVRSGLEVAAAAGSEANAVLPAAAGAGTDDAAAAGRADSMASRGSLLIRASVARPTGTSATATENAKGGDACFVSCVALTMADGATGVGASAAGAVSLPVVSGTSSSESSWILGSIDRTTVRPLCATHRQNAYTSCQTRRV